MRKPRYGLTLIELMVTTALAGMLLVVLLQVVTITGRTRALMQAKGENSEALSTRTQWRERLERELIDDINATRMIESKADGIVIEGHGGWSRLTREHGHEPARVTYRLVKTSPYADQPGFLIRGQRDLLDLGQQSVENELMATGVTAFGLGVSPDQSGNKATDTELTDSSAVVVEFADHSEIRVPVPAYLFADEERRR